MDSCEVTLEGGCITLLRLAKTDLPVPEPTDEIGAVDILTVINSWKENNFNHAGTESDQKNSNWKQQSEFDQHGKPRCFLCNAYGHFAAVTKTKAEVNWVGALSSNELVESNVDKRATLCGLVGGQSMQIYTA